MLDPQEKQTAKAAQGRPKSSRLESRRPALILDLPCDLGTLCRVSDSSSEQNSLSPAWSALPEWSCSCMWKALRRGPWGPLALAVEQSAYSRRMWKNIPGGGCQKACKVPYSGLAQGRHVVLRIIITEEAAAEKLYGLCSRSQIRCSLPTVLPGLSAITALSKPWFGCKMSALVLSLPRCWTIKCCV